MDKPTNVRRQLGTLGSKTPGEGTPGAVMEPPYDTGGMGEPSAPGKMPGEGMQGAAMGAPSATGTMPGEGMQGAAMGAPSATGGMPGAGMHGAAIEAPSAPPPPAPGKMPGEGMQGEGMAAPSAKMPGRKTVVAEKPVARHHVLVKPGEALAAAPAVGLGPYTKRGSTANFDVYYDNSLGTTGQNLADAVLANCEWDLFELRGWFGGVAAGRFSIYIDPGSFGAYHANCAATELHLAAFGGTDGALENMLDVAEADEVMMQIRAPAGIVARRREE